MGNTRLAVTVSEQDSEYIESVVSAGEFTTRSDYIRHLVRQDKQKAIANLEKLLQEGIDSGTSEQPPKEIFAELRENINRIGGKKPI